MSTFDDHLLDGPHEFESESEIVSKDGVVPRQFRIGFINLLLSLKIFESEKSTPRLKGMRKRYVAQQWLRWEEKAGRRVSREKAIEWLTTESGGGNFTLSRNSLS